MNKRLSAPLIVDFNVTSRCNLKCSFCYADAITSPDNNELTLDEIEALFDVFDEMNIHVVRISGGEPFIRSDILDILKKAESHNFVICINSNGTLLTDELIKELENSNIVDIVISLDGPNAKIHDQSRGISGAFDKTINCLKKLHSNCYDRLSTTCTLTSYNCEVDIVRDIILLNISLGIKTLGFQVTSPVGRCSVQQELVPTPEQWERVFLYLSEAKSIYKNINIVVNPTNEGEVYFEYYFPLIKNNKIELLKDVWKQDYENYQRNDYISCVAGNITIAIASNGDVYPCELMMDNEALCIGNIRDISFKKLWSDSELLDKIHNTKKKELIGKCSECNYDFCGGGCRAVAHSCTDNLWESDTRCPLTKVGGKVWDGN